MAIVSISRCSYSHGTMVAKKLAEELDYKLVSEEIITLASEEYDVPENWLQRAIQSAPKLVDRFRYGKKKYLAYIQSALLEYAVKDNIVYHGLKGQFLLEGIPHVLRVQVTGTMDERIRELMRRQDVSEKEAPKILEKFDKDRKKWALYFHGKDPWDLRNYDLGVVIGRLSVDEAVDIIKSTVGLPCFQTTPEAVKVLEQQHLRARVKSDLMNFYSDVEVAVEDGTVIIHIQRGIRQEEAVADDIKEIAMQIPGVKEVRVNVIPV